MAQIEDGLGLAVEEGRVTGDEPAVHGGHHLAHARGRQERDRRKGGGGPHDRPGRWPRRRRVGKLDLLATTATVQAWLSAISAIETSTEERVLGSVVAGDHEEHRHAEVGSHARVGLLGYLPRR